MLNDIDVSALLMEISDPLARNLAEARTSSEIAQAMQQIHACAERWLDEHQDPQQRRAIACGPGCGTCCIVNIAVLFPEAVAIDQYLREAFEPEKRAEILQRLTSLARDIRWLEDEERILLRRPCAFLNAAGSCAIYPVRPLLCRSVTSADAESCRTAVAMQAFGETHPVLMNLFQKDLMESVFEAAGERLSRAGRDARGFNLTRTVCRLAEGPDLVQSWLAGATLAH